MKKNQKKNLQTQKGKLKGAETKSSRRMIENTRLAGKARTAQAGKKTARQIRSQGNKQEKPKTYRGIQKQNRLTATTTDKRVAKIAKGRKIAQARKKTQRIPRKKEVLREIDRIKAQEKSDQPQRSSRVSSGIITRHTRQRLLEAKRKPESDDKSEKDILKNILMKEKQKGSQSKLESKKFSQSDVRALKSSDREAQLTAARKLRRLVVEIKSNRETDTSVDEIIAMNIIPRLIEFLKEESGPKLPTVIQNALKVESMWTLANIAHGTTDHVRRVVEAGVIPLGIQLVNSDNGELQEEALLCLNNIACDCAAYRDLILQSGVIPPVLSILPSCKRLPSQRIAAQLIAQLCKVRPYSPFEVIAPCLPVLWGLLSSPDEDLLMYTLWGLTYIAMGNNHVEDFISGGVCHSLVELLRHPSAVVIRGALAALGAIVSGDDVQTQAVYDSGALSVFPSLLRDERLDIIQRVLWALSNMAAGNRTQLQTLIESNLIPTVISILNEGKEPYGEDASWVLRNFTQGSSEGQIRYFVSHKGIQSLLDVLPKESNDKVITNALFGLRMTLRTGAWEASRSGSRNPYVKMIREYRGLDKLATLKNSTMNVEVQQSIHIILQYFE